MVHAVSFVGRSGSGKTTYLEKVVRLFKNRGFRVAVAKHTSHGFDLDRPGKDSWRLAQAGGDIIILTSAHSFAYLERRNGELALEDVIQIVEGKVDLLITEGYRKGELPKIEVCRAARSTELLCDPQELMAIVADFPLPFPLPQFPLDDASALVGFITNYLGLTDPSPR